MRLAERERAHLRRAALFLRVLLILFVDFLYRNSHYLRSVEEILDRQSSD